MCGVGEVLRWGRFIPNHHNLMGMEVCASSQAGELYIQSKPGQYSEILSQKREKKIKLTLFITISWGKSSHCLWEAEHGATALSCVCCPPIPHITELMESMVSSTLLALVDRSLPLECFFPGHVFYSKKQRKTWLAMNCLSCLKKKKNLLSENDSEKKNQNLILNLSMTLDKRLLLLPKAMHLRWNHFLLCFSLICEKEQGRAILKHSPVLSFSPCHLPRH